jgi:hypothetical protein
LFSTQRGNNEAIPAARLFALNSLHTDGREYLVNIGLATVPNIFGSN